MRTFSIGNWMYLDRKTVTLAVRSIPSLTSQQRRSALGQIKYGEETRCLEVLTFLARHLGMELRAGYIDEPRTYGRTPREDTPYKMVPKLYASYIIYARDKNGWEERYTVIDSWVPEPNLDRLRYLLERDISLYPDVSIEAWGPFPIVPGLSSEIAY